MKNLRLFALVVLLVISLPTLTARLAASEAVAYDPQLLAAARAANDVYQRHLKATQQALSASDEAEQLAAIAWLGRSNDPAVVPHLMPLLNADTQSDAVVEAAMLSLTWLGADISPQLRLLAQRHPHLDAVAYNGLARIQRWGGEDWKARAEVSDDAIRASSITNLGNDIAHGAGEILANAMLNDPEPHIRRMATIGLGKLGDPAYGPQLARALTDPNPMVRRYAANAMVTINYVDGIPNLLMAMQSNVAGQHLNRALIAISGEDFGFDHRGHLAARQEAIEKAFQWYTAQQR